MRGFIVLGVGMLLVAGLAVGGDAKNDLAKLQGNWKSDVEGKKFDCKIAKDTFVISMDLDGKKMTFKGTLKIDPSKKPAAMDLKITEAEKYKGETALAIFHVDGDTLKWCSNEPGKEQRPTEFPDKEGQGGHMYVVFKRIK